MAWWLLLGWMVTHPAPVAESVAYLEGETGHCTTFSVAVTRWVTDDHCVDAYGSTKINGIETTMIREDHKRGLALLGGPPVAPLTIARKEPSIGESVTLYGWPADWPDSKPLPFFGHLQALHVPMIIDHEPTRTYNFFHEGGGQGMSGGPIVNAAGEVVGVILGSGQYPSISVAAISVTELRAFLELK